MRETSGFMAGDVSLSNLGVIAGRLVILDWAYFTTWTFEATEAHEAWLEEARDGSRNRPPDPNWEPSPEPSKATA